MNLDYFKDKNGGIHPKCISLSKEELMDLSNVTYASHFGTWKQRMHIKTFSADSLQALELAMDTFLKENEVTVHNVQIDIPSNQGVIVYFGDS